MKRGLAWSKTYILSPGASCRGSIPILDDIEKKKLYFRVLRRYRYGLLLEQVVPAGCTAKMRIEIFSELYGADLPRVLMGSSNLQARLMDRIFLRGFDYIGRR